MLTTHSWTHFTSLLLATRAITIHIVAVFLIRFVESFSLLSYMYGLNGWRFRLGKGILLPAVIWSVVVPAVEWETLMWVARFHHGLTQFFSLNVRIKPDQKIFQPEREIQFSLCIAAAPFFRTCIFVIF